MARQIRRKSKAKTARAKTKVKARGKRTTRAKPKATKRTAKRRTARPKAKTGIVAAVTGALQTVADTFKETALLRNKMEPPGKSETG